jgi:adenylate cyclase
MESRKLLAEAEQRAEWVAAVVRMLGVAIACAAYFFAATGPAGALSQEYLASNVPLVVGTLAAMFGVGLASLWTSHPARFRPWMPWLYTTCDFVLLFAVIALFSENLGLHAEAVMALLPPVWLVPIYFALAMLRYNPYLQTYAVVLAVGGALGIGAFLTPPPVALPAARSVHDELMGFGPNLMRVTMILIVGGILIVAALRARQLLHRAIAETVRRGNLTRYLPRELVDRLADASLDQARAGRQQNAAVLFADIRGFTDRAERMEPAALSRFVTEFRRSMIEAATETHGVVDKFVGDSVMIVFGVPEPGERDARDALACARAILAAVAAWNDRRAEAGDDPVRIGVGVHWGRVFSGAVGDEQRLEFTVLGDAVNVAARLEDATKEAGVALLVSEDLLKAAGEQAGAGWSLVRDAPIRGRRESVRIYTVSAGLNSP